MNSPALFAPLASSHSTNFGSGVPADSLTRIFDPFYRIDHARNRDTGGSGLGLAIAQKAIEIHGGRISARNAAPGLVVEIDLPGHW